MAAVGVTGKSDRIPSTEKLPLSMKDKHSAIGS
jgi:hypothetical protein